MASLYSSRSRRADLIVWVAVLVAAPEPVTTWLATRPPTRRTTGTSVSYNMAASTRPMRAVLDSFNGTARFSGLSARGVSAW